MLAASMLQGCARSRKLSEFASVKILLKPRSVIAGAEVADPGYSTEREDQMGSWQLPPTATRGRPVFAQATTWQARPPLHRTVNFAVLLDELTQALPTLSPSRAFPSMSPHPGSAPFKSKQKRESVNRDLLSVISAVQDRQIRFGEPPKPTRQRRMLPGICG